MTHSSVTPFVTVVRSAIQRNPTAFNSFTGGCLCALSDVTAQRMERKSINGNTAKLNQRRFLAAGFLGMLFGGCVYPNAYAMLDARFHSKTFPSLLTKSVVEIATVGVFVNAVSMTCRGILMGHEIGTVRDHVVQEMPKVVRNDVKVWLPYNLLAFTVIPPLIRPTTTAMMEACWKTYISLRSNDYEDRAATASAKHCLE